MSFDIDLYVDSSYNGFWPPEVIEDYFQEYHSKATELARNIDWDEIILYAIYCFDEETEAFISADFMLLRMDYCRYCKFAEKIAPGCRLFFVRNQ